VRVDQIPTSPLSGLRATVGDRTPATHAELVSFLYKGHYVSLCRTARLMVDDPGRAEELVQDAFTRTLSKARALRRPEATLGYIRRAVVHACHSELRRRGVERRIGAGAGGSSLEAASELPPAPGVATADLVSEREAVLGLLRALPPRQREAVVLRYYADLDEAGVAHAMRCSVGTVKSQLSQARRQLAQLLDAGNE
jgi:RNA polymerase sigma factor (sigma-70 family)